MTDNRKNVSMFYRLGQFQKARNECLRIIEQEPDNVAILEQLGVIALWENKTDEAEMLFKEALHCLPFYKQYWPANSQLKYRLAMTCYRQDRCAEAADLFYEAAGSGPTIIRPFQTLLAFGEQMAMFRDKTPFLIEGPEESGIPFLVTDPLPVLVVSINGKGPFNFFIDTGAADVIIDRTLVDKVGARISGSFRADYAGHREVEIGLGMIDSLQMGDFIVRNVPIHSLNTKAMSEIFDGIEVSGVIGTRLLMHFLSTIDYANGMLFLRRIAPYDGQNCSLFAKHSAAKVIPFWLIETHYIVAWGTVNYQEPVLLFVDTGLGNSGFTAPASYLRQSGVFVDWSHDRTSITGGGEVNSADFVVDRLTLGTGENEIVEHDVPGIAMEGFVSITGEQLGFNIGGLISHLFFHKHALTFDFTGMKLIVR